MKIASGLVLFFLWFTFPSIYGQKYLETVIYSAFYDGILPEQLVRDPSLSELVIMSDGRKEVQYVIDRSDSLIVLSNYIYIEEERVKKREQWYDPSFNILREVVMIGEYDRVITEVQYIDDEEHYYSYDQKFDEDQNLIQSDTSLNILRLFDYRGYHTNKVSITFDERRIDTLNWHFLYWFDDQDRLIEERGYKEMDLDYGFRVEYLDEQQMVKVFQEGVGLFDDARFNLFYHNEQLVRLEVGYGSGGFNTIREFKYDNQGRLVRLKEMYSDGEVTERIRFVYK
ncbi:MAG: hypothetical protein AAFY36_19480 [Bacteroidota bacterium]